MMNEWINTSYGVKRLKEWSAMLDQIIPYAMLPHSELTEALKRDHQDLRTLMQVLKSDKPIAVKRTAYKKFAKLLDSHSKSEARAVYEISLNYRGLVKKTLEGLVEHDIAGSLAEKIKTIRQPDKWLAAVQVLAELVEHHVNEEERDFFPLLDKLLDDDVKLQAESEFIGLRKQTQDFGSDAGILSVTMN